VRPDAAAATLWLTGLQQTAESRTNLALVGTADGGPATMQIDVELFSGETGRSLGVFTRELLARGFVQLARVLTLVPGGAAAGYARVTRRSGTGAFTAYAVVNDGANPGERSGDGAFVRSVPE
jgi:hypothetical protein